MTVATYWCESAELPAGIAHEVRISVDDGRITEVRERARRLDDDIVLAGVTLPGFANTHSHAFHRALRGRLQGDGGNFWTWREGMYAVTRRLDPDMYHLLARAVFAEMVLAGYTVVGEFHYVHHDHGGERYADPNAMGLALVRAAAEAGIRLTLLDTCYLAGGLTAEGHLPLDAAQERFSDASVDAWAARVDDLATAEPVTQSDRVRIGAAAHSVRAVPRGDLARVATVARGRGMPLHLHLSEQPAENAATLMLHAMTPAALCADEDVLGPGTTVVHATHLTDDDRALLADSGTTACFCPTTERDLADGIGPARLLADAGVSLAIGSDEQAVIDPFEELRALEMHERLMTNERGHFTLAELLTVGTENGYRSLGWPDGGRLERGALADFISVNPASVRTAGSRPGQLVFSATEADVTDVVVGGRRVVEAGQHVALGPIAPLLVDALAVMRETE